MGGFEHVRRRSRYRTTSSQNKTCAFQAYVPLSSQTVSAIFAFFLFITLNPEVQARAQEEIDRVTGGSRLPNLTDRDELPYVDALVKEVLRCANILPQGGERGLEVDDVYNGYLFPAKSIIIPNVW
jgi:cytochrome P450